MWLFSGRKNNYKTELREQIKSFMIDYIRKYPNSADDVLPIFSQADSLVQNLSGRKIYKSVKCQGHSVEKLSLNIIQNCAMMALNPKSGIDYLQCNDYVHSLYDYVNELKFEKGFIGRQQFEENKMLGTQLSLVSPLGGW